jgi:hypothetical protein
LAAAGSLAVGLSRYLDTKSSEIVATTPEVAAKSSSHVTPEQKAFEDVNLNELANEHVVSEERNNELGLAVNSFAEQIVNLAENGERSQVDFRGNDAGFGYLIYETQPGHKDSVMAATELTQKKDGGFDLDTVASISVIAPNYAVSIARPSKDDVWEVSVVASDQKTGEFDFENARVSKYMLNDTPTVEYLKGVESDAVKIFDKELNKLTSGQR